MSSLVVGGVAIKVAVSSPRWTRMDAVDRARAFDNTFRASQTGGAVRVWDFETPAVLASTEGETYKAALSTVASQLCLGDIIALPTMCSAELTDGVPTSVAGDPYVVLSFALHEVQPAKVLLRYSPGDTITGETFTRASTAHEIISTGVLTSRAVDVKRDAHYIGGVRTALREDTRANICLQAENFGTTWTVQSTPTRVAAANTASGVTLDLIGDDDAVAAEAYLQSIVFTGDAVKAISIHVKAGTSISFVIRLVDTTAGSVNRLLVSMDLLGTGGAPRVITLVTGTYLGYETLADGVFRLLFATTSVVAANTNSLRLYPAMGTSLSGVPTGDVYMGGVQCENAPVPSSYIPTTTAAVTRSVDSHSLPFTFPPGELSVYAKFIERGTIGGTLGIFQLSNAASAAPRLFALASGGVYLFQHQNATVTVFSALAVAPAYGDTVELIFRVFGDGSVQIGQSIAGGAATYGAQSAANAFASAWSDDLLWLNSLGTIATGLNAFQSLKIVAGARSLAEMRAL